MNAEHSLYEAQKMLPPPKQTKKGKGIILGEGFDIFEDKWFPNLKNSEEDIARRYYAHTAPLFANKPIDIITSLQLEDYSLTLFRKLNAAASP